LLQSEKDSKHKNQLDKTASLLTSKLGSERSERKRLSEKPAVFFSLGLYQLEADPSGINSWNK
jgi:hypothetical protein